MSTCDEGHARFALLGRLLSLVVARLAALLVVAGIFVPTWVGATANRPFDIGCINGGGKSVRTVIQSSIISPSIRSSDEATPFPVMSGRVVRGCRALPVERDNEPQHTPFVSFTDSKRHIVGPIIGRVATRSRPLLPLPPMVLWCGAWRDWSTHPNTSLSGFGVSSADVDRWGVRVATLDGPSPNGVIAN